MDRHVDARRALLLAGILVIAGASTRAEAYIGPGGGLSLLTMALAMLATYIVSVMVVLTWPVRAARAWLHRRREKGGRVTKEVDQSHRSMLGTLVLRNQSAWRTLSSWESRFLAQRLATPIDRPVFITALARAGTTIMLRKLCELSEFASHRYSDFPFLFTPYAWILLRKLTSAGRQAPHERMHRDGIMVTAESPEAMEEVLWMAFFTDIHDPAHSNVLDAATRHPEFEAFFADHIRKLTLARGTPRYISKNNYNVTRMPYLARIFPDARFLVPIRAPVAHVASLMKQHELFREIESSNDKARKYLSLVGHLEFGLDRRPINTGDHEAVSAIERCWRDGDDVRGWAKYWSLIYRHVTGLIETDPDLAERALIVRYEDLCDGTSSSMSSICSHIGIDVAQAERLSVGLRSPEYYAPQFTDEQRAIITEETAQIAGRFGYA